MRSYVTEFIGTFFLVLTVCLTCVAGNKMAPLAIGASLMVMVYMGGHISGAHYNPAVSLAVMVRGKLEPVEFVIYVIAQILGAIAAAGASLAITHRTFAPTYDPGNVMGSLLVEFFYSFALALVVLNVATAKKTEGNSYYGLAIGFTVMVGAFAGGAISGGAFNPSVAFGPILVDTFNSGTSMSGLWLYLLGPFAGGALAGLVFRYQNPTRLTAVFTTTPAGPKETPPR